MFLSHLMKLKLIKSYKELNSNNITPGDFTLLAQNLPYNKNENEVKEYFHHLLPEIEIQKVNFTYDIKEMAKLG